MSYLTPGQDAFAIHLAHLSGLNPNTIRAWTLAEESGSAAQQREAQKNFNFLNVGYFDSGPGSLTHDQTWGNPQAAAQATYDFLSGKRWGADPRIQSILKTAGQSPQAQLRAIWTSPWASSQYGHGRDLMSTYKMVAGMPVPTTGPAAAAPVAATAPATTGLDAQMAAAADPATAATDPAATAAMQRRAGIQDLINSNARLAHIPTIHLPQIISAPVQVEAPVAKRLTATPTGQKVLGSQLQTAIVKAAKQFLGVPYVWGGTSPSGFDCSGLMQYVFHKFGINIPRVTYDQVKAGKLVPKNAMQPGDLVFFSNKESGVHHVGMYIGNGQYLQAPHTGDVVKISSLAGRSDFYEARRFV